MTKMSETLNVKLHKIQKALRLRWLSQKHQIK